MGPKLRYSLAVVLLLGAGTTHAREWAAPSGSCRFEAELVAVEGDQVVLRMPNGAISLLKSAELSAADQEYIKGAMSSGKLDTKATYHLPKGKPFKGDESTKYQSAFAMEDIYWRGEELAFPMSISEGQVVYGKHWAMWEPTKYGEYTHYRHFGGYVLKDLGPCWVVQGRTITNIPGLYHYGRFGTYGAMARRHQIGLAVDQADVTELKAFMKNYSTTTTKYPDPTITQFPSVKAAIEAMCSTPIRDRVTPEAHLPALIDPRSEELAAIRAKKFWQPVPKESWRRIRRVEDVIPRKEGSEPTANRHNFAVRGIQMNAKGVILALQPLQLGPVKAADSGVRLRFMVRRVAPKDILVPSTHNGGSIGSRGLTALVKREMVAGSYGSRGKLIGVDHRSLTIGSEFRMKVAGPGWPGWFKLGRVELAEEPLSDGKWHAVELWYDASSSKIKLWVDGVLRESPGPTKRTFVRWQQDADLKIEPFGGPILLADFQTNLRKASAEEIKAREERFQVKKDAAGQATERLAPSMP